MKHFFFCIPGKISTFYFIYSTTLMSVRMRVYVIIFPQLQTRFPGVIDSSQMIGRHNDEMFR